MDKTGNGCQIYRNWVLSCSLLIFPTILRPLEFPRCPTWWWAFTVLGVHFIPVVTFTYTETRQKYCTWHSETWWLWFRSMLAFAAAPQRQPSWEKLLKSTNLMRPVGSPSPNICSLWTSWDTDVRYMATERTEDCGMQLENKPVVFVKSDD